MSAEGVTAARPRPYADVPAFPATGAVDLVALAGRRAEIELEIGFGRGRFALERAAGNPGAFVIGVETRRKHVHTAAALAAKRGLDNAVFRYGDARELVARFAPDGCLARVFVNFPDPWWKARHAKRAVVSAALLREVARLLGSGGELFVQTDVLPRAEAFRAAFASASTLVPAAPGGFVEGNPYGAISNRERRCVEAGVPIYRLRYFRR